MRVDRLLWVDDQREFMVSATPLIADMVSEIRYCLNTEEALQAFDSWKPNLILLDLKMPPNYWGGLDLLKQLGNKTRITPIIVLSGAGTITQCIEALELGAIHYVEKERIVDDLKKGIEIALSKFHSAQPLDDYNRVRNIERDLHEIILGAIRSEAVRTGQTDIFLKLIPKDIALKSYQRRIEVGGGDQEQFLDLIDLRSIVDRNNKLPIFGLLDVVVKPARREDRTKWMVDLNEIRKIIAHPVRNQLSDQQRLQLQYLETIIKGWNKLIAERK